MTKEHYYYVATELTMEYCRRNVPWEIAAEIQLEALTKLLDYYINKENLRDTYNYWYEVREILKNQLEKK